MEGQRIKKVTLDEKTYRAVMDKLLAQEAELSKLRDENKTNKVLLDRLEKNVKEMTKKINSSGAGGCGIDNHSLEAFEYARDAPQRLKDIVAKNFSLDAVKSVNAFKIETTSTRYLKAETEGEIGRFVTEQKTASWKLLLRKVDDSGDTAYVTGFIDGLRAPILPPPIYESDEEKDGGAELGETRNGDCAFVDVTQVVTQTLSNLPQPPRHSQHPQPHAKVSKSQVQMATKTIANKYKVRRTANQKTMKQIRDELYLSQVRSPMQSHRLPEPNTS